MEYVKLKEVCEISMGQSPDSSSYNKEMIGVPFFQGNADFGEKNPDARAWTTKPRKMALINDILISVRAPIGALNYANKNCCIGRGLASIRPIKDFYLKEYIFYLLKSKKDELNKLGTGSTFKAINKSVLENLKVPILNVNDQTKIVKQLDMIKHIIKKEKTQISFFDNLIKSRFVEMFGDPEINPKNWEQVTVKDVCSSIVRGPFGSMLKKEFFVEKGKNTYKVYEQKNAIQKNAFIGTYYVDSKKFTELKRFECISGDILMSCSGTMGKLYQLPTNCEKGLINQALCKFTLNSKILPVVFLTYMNETIGKLETKGSGIKNIAAVSYVKAMPINIPPIELQYQFANFVEQVNKSKFIVDSIRTLMEMIDSNCFPN